MYAQKTYKFKNCAEKILREKKTSKGAIEFICFGHLLLSTSPAFRCGLHPQWDSVGEN